MMKIKKNAKFSYFLLLALLFMSPLVWSSDGEEMVLSRGTGDASKLKFNVSESNKPDASVAVEQPSMGSSLRVVGLWLVLLGLGGGAFVFLKRRQRMSVVGGKSEVRLTLLERLPLGAHRELLLIKACDRLLVVSSQGNQMSLLSDLPSENSPSLPFAGIMEAQEEGVFSSRTAADDPAKIVVRHPRLREYAQASQAPSPSRPVLVSSSEMPAWPGAES